MPLVISAYHVAMAEGPTAKAFLAEHGAAIEYEVTRFIESRFARVVEGAPRRVSQYGVPYEEIICLFDCRIEPHELMPHVRALIEAALPPKTEDMTVVWRVRPQLYDAPRDFATETFESERQRPFVVKLRCRCHTLPGTRDPEPETLHPRERHE